MVSEQIIRPLENPILFKPVRSFKKMRKNLECALRNWNALKFYSKFIKKGDLVFDVGANVGNRTELFLYLGALVVAVEPQEVCLQELRRRYKADKRVIILEQALGAQTGQAKMMLCNRSGASSFSDKWIEQVKASGRFQDCNWDSNMIVAVSTLDKLIENYGEPAFCKIDVEGYEHQVLLGLSRPIRALSFEFTPEFIEPAIESINHVSRMGRTRFNYSLEESMQLALPKWVTSNEICEILPSLPDKTVYGDVYCKYS